LGGSRGGASTSTAPSSSTPREERRRELVERLLQRVVAPDGRLIVCGYGSPRSGIPTDPVRRVLREWDYAPELELAAEAPEGGGPIVELAALGV
jgi:hypothetical protein